MAKMHADEVETDAKLVQRLVRGQFPQWGHLPVERLASPSGSVTRPAPDRGVEPPAGLGQSRVPRHRRLTRLPYYRHTNPVISANARHVIGEILKTKEAATWPPSSR